jgi:hypothetical protein
MVGLQQVAHAFELRHVDQRSDIGVLVQRIADAQLCHAGTDALEEGLRDALLYQEARTRTADLALVEPDAVDEAFHSRIEIGIIEDHEGRLAT